jgi:hypothetical protein
MTAAKIKHSLIMKYLCINNAPEWYRQVRELIFQMSNRCVLLLIYD